MELWSKVKTPMLKIHLILALMLILYGMYIGSPFYVADSTTGLGLLFAQKWVIYLTAITYFAPGAITLIGLHKASWSWLAAGSFGMMLAFLFSTLLRLLVIGWIPAIWLFYLALVGISGVCYLYDHGVDPK